jgi:ribosomal protein S18 acetylase RimI-like enzyme
LIRPLGREEETPKGRWAARIDRPGMNTLLTLDGNKIVGVSGYGRYRLLDMKDYGEIISIYLLPEYFGRGHGKQLLD